MISSPTPAAALSSPGSGSEPTDEPTAPARPRSSYVVSLPIDVLLVGLASIVLYLVLRTRTGWAHSDRISSMAATLVWVANYPHFAATNYRLYHRRANIAQYPATALLVPVVVLAGVVGSFLDPVTIAPAFVLMYQLWSPYHFSGQTVGVAMVYSRRTGFAVDGALRWMLGAFVFATFAHQIARFSSTTNPVTFYGVTYPNLGIPDWVTDATRWWMWGTGAGLLVLFAIRSYTSGRIVPLAIVVPVAAQFVWFAATPAGDFFYLVPFFHSVQYLLMAWAVQRTERSPQRSWLELGRWFAINVALGVALFWVLPRIGAGFGRSLAFSTAIVFAGIQLHHFFVDGVIWRLRNVSVERALTGTTA